MFLQVSQQLRASHYVPLTTKGKGKRIFLVFDGSSVHSLETVTVLNSKFEGDVVLFKFTKQDFSIQGNKVKLVTINNEHPEGIDYSLGQIGILLHFNSSMNGTVIAQVE